MASKPNVKDGPRFQRVPMRQVRPVPQPQARIRARDAVTAEHAETVAQLRFETTARLEPLVRRQPCRVIPRP